MGIAALVTALVLQAHALQHRQHVIVHPVWPAQGTITSPFGRDGYRYHPGIDIGILRSLAVRAAVSGKVVRVGEPRGFSGYGNVVVIRSHGYDEIYAHLSAWRVHGGEIVLAGQRIATAGCTGYCTGTHLHFEVRPSLMARAVSPWRTVLRPLLHPARPVVRQLAVARPVAVPHKPLL